MKIHEYQGKALLKEYGVPVPRGIVARTPDEAEAAATQLGTDVVVVKAQIHAGGRGKGGGVKLAKSPDEAKQIASEILGMQLVTHQTGPEGREVKTLLIEEGLPIDKEFYLGITLDRVTGRNVFMASSAGGMDIEKVAEETPELILKETIDPSVGLRGFQARKLAFGLGIPNDLIEDLRMQTAVRRSRLLRQFFRCSMELVGRLGRLRSLSRGLSSSTCGYSSLTLQCRLMLANLPLSSRYADGT